MLSEPLGGRGGEGRSGRGCIVGTLKGKGRTSIGNSHYNCYFYMSSIWPSMPFCFSLKFCQDSTAVTIPNTVTVATHSATKEVVVAMKTPEEGGTEINRDKLT